MSPVEPAPSGFFEFRFRWKTLAQPLAIIRSFMPVDVGDGKLLFPFWNFAFGPVPGRAGAFCFDVFDVIGVRYLVFVDVERVEINVIGGPIVDFIARHEIAGIQEDRECAAHPEFTSGDQHHAIRRCSLRRGWQRGANEKRNDEYCLFHAS